MPTPRQTVPPPSRNAKARTLPQSKVDPLLDGVPANELGDDWVHALIYGRNRIGKTTLACQSEKPLALIAIEHTKTGGARSITKIPGVEVFRYKNSAQVTALGERLHSDNKFKTVVVDSGTSLDEIVLAEVCGWDTPALMNKWGKVSEDQYTERSERMRKILRTFFDLDKHVFLLANEKDHNPSKGERNSLVRGVQHESFFAAAMGGATTRWCMDGCDSVCQLYMDKEVIVRRRVVGKKGTPSYKVIDTPEETGRLVRRLRMQYHVNFAAGIRSADPDQVPEYVEGDRPEDMFANFLSVIRGEYEKPVENSGE